jgi:8-oxo-dGTP diphosphatase
MRRRVADALYRCAYAVGFRLARLVWAFTHPRHEGALVAIRVGPALLMLRQSYRPELSMPGGGVRPGEDPAHAACRELAEELGLQVAPGDLRFAHRASGLWDGRHDSVTFFELDLPQLPLLRFDNREVVGARLVALEALGPADVTPAIGAYLAWRRMAGAPQ